MGLKLEWEWNGGHGVATAGGLRLVVRNCYHPVTWQIRSGPWGEDSHEVEVIDDDWRAATLAAQEAAEAAAARLLAEDAGVRALVSLIGDALTGTPADEPMRGLVDFIAVHVERDAMRARVAELEASLRWIPVTEGLPRLGQRVVLLRQTGTPFQHARVVSLCSEGGQTPAWWDDCYGGISGGPGDVWMEIPGYTAGPEVGQ